MALQFIGEAGVYLPKRDAIKITAITVGSHIDCYVTRSALAAIGCTRYDSPLLLIERFEENRLEIELAAMIKYRRATSNLFSLDIEASDLKALEPSPHRASASLALSRT